MAWGANKLTKCTKSCNSRIQSILPLSEILKVRLSKETF